MSKRLVVDLRNIYRREDICRHGFEYVNIGDGATDDRPVFSAAAE
jgi:UDPglucose 6-dehydrogenase